MQRLIIDCRTGKEIYLDLTPDEKRSLEQDRQKRQVQDRIERQNFIKQRLITTLLEIAEMQRNRDIFGDDISAKQAEIDNLKEEIKAL